MFLFKEHGKAIEFMRFQRAEIKILNESSDHGWYIVIKLISAISF